MPERQSPGQSASSSSNRSRWRCQLQFSVSEKPQARETVNIWRIWMRYYRIVLICIFCYISKFEVHFLPSKIVHSPYAYIRLKRKVENADKILDAVFRAHGHNMVLQNSWFKKMYLHLIGWNWPAKSNAMVWHVRFDEKTQVHVAGRECEKIGRLVIHGLVYTRIRCVHVAFSVRWIHDFFFYKHDHTSLKKK